ncbi:LPS export ABC transporter ATP-binding protein [Methylocella tundrae]|uniref:Putative ABC transporter ATP-binding protein AZC_3926 n=1 Tax=Methylocella tundrae TaxID=227605 RepID=A0A4U8YTQ7_METTU|nr:LPS export ABC transporter ATP-binding protein [Methylocella tundrae]WPP04856.1 LPS export ABC transporter ATP-binding protein [Methylocella tundrae]VFU07107.1 putative ABC transporter ATP-binding protein AZC_3926 [Methylocella tundrae]
MAVRFFPDLAAVVGAGSLFWRRQRRPAENSGAWVIEKEVPETSPDVRDWRGAEPAAQDDAFVAAGDGRVSSFYAASEGVLCVRQLRKAYKMRRIIEDVSMYVRRGEAVGLLGPNGAGKTTLFYMISGLVRPDAGRIELDGHDVTRLPMYRRARLGIGYLPQEPSIFRGLSVEDNIRAVLEITQRDRRKRELELEALLDEFDIKALRKSPSVALSGGERRRCEIARALASRPAFILLDEPFAGVDPIAVADIQLLVHHLKRRGIGVLITDHNVRETLGLIDRAYIIHAGRVLTEGAPEEIVGNADVRRFYLGDDFQL